MCVITACGMKSLSAFWKTECMPSHRIWEMLHKLWAIVEKKTGAVKSAYGSCFAGKGFYVGISVVKHS